MRIAGGTLLGVFFGMIFGGVRGRSLDAVFGPEDDEEESGRGPRLMPSENENGRGGGR